MRLFVHAPVVSQVHREQIQERFETAFDRFGEFVQQAWVRLSDENGPRGGRDQSCLVRVAIQGGPDVVVTERRDEPLEAVAHAIRRVRRELSDQINKRAKRRKAGGSRRDE
ncbi:MAG: hypothetical protein AAGG46_01550 [Planctomycetota bacterium]